VCKILQLLSVVVRTMNKFDFRLVINETCNKWWPVLVKKTTSRSDRLMSLTGS